MVTSSSLLLIVTTVILLAGFMYSDRVQYTEDDFDRENGVLHLDFESGRFGVLQYTLDYEKDVRVSVRIINPSGRTVHTSRGEVPLTAQVTLDRSGTHSIEMEILSGDGDPKDLEIEISLTDESIFFTCCGAFFSGALSFTLLIMGAVFTMIGTKEGRR
jgi:hypothetical protein